MLVCNLIPLSLALTYKNHSNLNEFTQERQLSSAQLNELVYEQWLMAEIQESSVPRLPEGLENKDICRLEGHFNLQVTISYYHITCNLWLCFGEIPSQANISIL